MHALGGGSSEELQASRYCASYRKVTLGENDDQDHDAFLEVVAEAVRQHRIEIVFPSDDVSTRLLATVRDRLPVASSLLPDLATFDLLNDKARFTRFALEHNIRALEFRLYEQAAAITSDLLGGVLELPVTVKPINRSASDGVVHIRTFETRKKFTLSIRSITTRSWCSAISSVRRSAFLSSVARAKSSRMRRSGRTNNSLKF